MRIAPAFDLPVLVACFAAPYIKIRVKTTVLGEKPPSLFTDT
jgi:hypothetical protein